MLEDSGRVRPADGVTINLVLEALKNHYPKVPYAIIVNKITKKRKDMIFNGEGTYELFVKSLNTCS